MIPLERRSRVSSPLLLPLLSLLATACVDTPVEVVIPPTVAGSDTDTDTGTTTLVPTTSEGESSSTTATTLALDSTTSEESTDASSSTTGAACGDGMADPGEACDGDDLAGETCETQGFDGGTLACDDRCELDVSGCYGCGDDVLDMGEDCDGFDLGGQTCEGLGFEAGVLLCACLLYTSRCV